jgi:predicted membrane protein
MILYLNLMKRGIEIFKQEKRNKKNLEENESREVKIQEKVKECFDGYILDNIYCLEDWEIENIIEDYFL